MVEEKDVRKLANRIAFTVLLAVVIALIPLMIIIVFNLPVPYINPPEKETVKSIYLYYPSPSSNNMPLLDMGLNGENKNATTDLKFSLSIFLTPKPIGKIGNLFWP